jgi:hypothetical protein
MGVWQSKSVPEFLRAERLSLQVQHHEVQCWRGGARMCARCGSAPRCARSDRDLARFLLDTYSGCSEAAGCAATSRYGAFYFSNWCGARFAGRAHLCHSRQDQHVQRVLAGEQLYALCEYDFALWHACATQQHGTADELSAAYPIYINLYNNMQLRHLHGGTTSRITAQIWPFPYTADQVAIRVRDTQRTRAMDDDGRPRRARRPR